MSGVESATTGCKSLIVAMALMEGRLSVDEAVDASHLETKFQVSEFATFNQRNV